MPRASTKAKNKNSKNIRIAAYSISAVAAILLVVVVWSWVHFVRNNPRRVYWSMMSNALNTTNVTQRTVQDRGTSQTDEVVQLFVAPKQAAHSDSEFRQGQGAESTNVTTESISSPAGDFVRYVDINTSQKTKKGQSFDFSGILNVWGKSDENPLTGSGQVFYQISQGAIPLGKLSLPQRQELIKFMQTQNVYKIDFAKVQRRHEGGRLYYVYDVTIQPTVFIAALKKFASFAGMTHLGGTPLEMVKPADYQGAPVITLTVSIDVVSQQLSSVIYNSGERIDTYSGFGATILPPAIPAKSIPLQELELRLQSLQ